MSLDSNVGEYYRNLLAEVSDNLVSFGWDKQFVEEHLKNFNNYSVFEESDLKLQRYKSLVHKIYLGLQYILKEYFLERSEFNSLAVDKILDLFDETYDKLISLRNEKRSSKSFEGNNEAELLTDLIHYGLGIENVESIFEIIYSDDDDLDENTIYEKKRSAIIYIQDFYFPEIILKKDE